MIVPTTKGQFVQTGSGEAPSEANLLMALAEMHKQGRFALGGGAKVLSIRSEDK